MASITLFGMKCLSSLIINVDYSCSSHGTVTRAHPIVDSLPVMYSDLIVSPHGIIAHGPWQVQDNQYTFKQALLYKRSQAELTEADVRMVISTACGYQVKRVVYTKVWYPLDGHLVLAVRAYNPRAAPLEKHIYFISMEKVILARYLNAKYVQGLAFPKDVVNINTKPTPVDLIDVVPSESKYSVHGSSFHSSNTCNQYACSNSSRGACTPFDSYCVPPSKESLAGRDYYTRNFTFTINAKAVSLEKDWESLGYKKSQIIVKWQDAPVFGSRIMQPTGNTPYGFETDFSKYTGAETDDSISELAAYHFFSLHYQFMNSLLNVTEFCFFGSGPNCQQYDPKTNSTGSIYTKSMPFAVNFYSIDPFPKQGTSQYPNMLAQLQNGKGKTEQDPIILDSSTTFGNAYYSPGTSTELKDCKNGACVSIMEYDLPHFAFGQDDTDWSLNSCIVFHELTHAYHNRFIPDLPTYTWSVNGINSEAGALQEAWSDYFAAINCGQYDFTKSLNGHPNRSLQNKMTCADMVGQIHTDSMIFSGALWSVRELLDSDIRVEFDRTVLKAMQLGHGTDNFESQLLLIHSLMLQNAKLAKYAKMAFEVFSSRVLACTKVTEFAENNDPTFVLPSALTTRGGISTNPTSLKFKVRASDWKIQLSWRQWFISPLLGSLSFGYGESKIKFAVAECPITFEDFQPQACNQSVEYVESTWDNKYGSIIFDANKNNAKIVHDQPVTMVLYSMDILFLGFNRIWRITLAVLGIVQALLFLSIIVRNGRRNLGFLGLRLCSSISTAGFAIAALYYAPLRDLLTYLGLACASASFALDIWIRGSGGTMRAFLNVCALGLVIAIPILTVSSHEATIGHHTIVYGAFLIFVGGGLLVTMQWMRKVDLVTLQWMKTVDHK